MHPIFEATTEKADAMRRLFPYYLFETVYSTTNFLTTKVLP